MALGTNPRHFNDNALAGLQVAGASGLLMFVVYLQIFLCIVAIRVGFKALVLVWHGVRWSARGAVGLFTAARQS